MHISFLELRIQSQISLEGELMEMKHGLGIAMNGMQSNCPGSFFSEGSRQVILGVDAEEESQVDKDRVAWRQGGFERQISLMGTQLGH